MPKRSFKIKIHKNEFSNQKSTAAHPLYHKLYFICNTHFSKVTLFDLMTIIYYFYLGFFIGRHLKELLLCKISTYLKSSLLMFSRRLMLFRVFYQIPFKRI